MKLVKAVPLRHERGAAFVMRARGCNLEDVRRPVYDIGPSARRLRGLRVERGLGLRDAAGRLGLRAVELSQLERGVVVPSNPSDWTVLLGRLQDGA